MPNIRARFITQDCIESAIIRMYTASWCSHVEFEWDGGWIGARFSGGVAVRTFDYCVPTKQIMVEFDVTDDQYAHWKSFMEQQIGKPYDWTALAGIVLRRDWRERDSWFCSELYCAAMEAIGMPLLNTDKVNHIWPGLAYMSPIPKVIT